MSNHLISTVYKRQLGSHMRKSVMALLADKASDDGSGIWASKQTLADELCCSKQTVIATIQGFIADGLVHENGTRKCSTGATVEYRIDVAAVEALPLVNCHAKQSSQLTGQEASPVKSTVSRGQAAGPKPSRTILSSEAKASSQRGSRIPLDWEPGPLPANVAALVAEWPPGRELRELEGFRDYWTARTRDAARLNWDLTWHNRIRDMHDRIIRENRNARQPMGRNQPSDGLSPTTRAALRVFGGGDENGFSGRADEVPRLGCAGGYG